LSRTRRGCISRIFHEYMHAVELAEPRASFEAANLRSCDIGFPKEYVLSANTFSRFPIFLSFHLVYFLDYTIFACIFQNIFDIFDETLTSDFNETPPR